MSKFLDLDRCYTVCRVPVDNGKYLVLYNIHLSAYGGDDSIREGQTSMLFEDMAKEYENGNYIICGGDFNHDMRASEDAVVESTWAYAFPRSKMPSFLKFSYDINGDINNLPDSYREANAPYEAGKTSTYLIDGIIVSDNILVKTNDILNSGYLYSDHEPVYVTFELK